RPVLNAVLTNMEALSQAIVARLADDPRLSPRPTRRGPVLKALVEALLRTRLPFLVAGALLRPRAAADRVDQRMREVMALADTVPGAQAAELLDAYERSLLRGMGQLMPNAMSLAAAAMLAYGAAGRLLGPDATLDERRSLLRALPTSPTSQMNLALWALAQQAKADPASASALRDRTAAALAEAHHGGRLPITLQRGLDEFLARYGHRGVAEIDLGVPRWSEDPTHILLVLQNYVRPGDLEAAPDVQFSRLAGEADAMVEELARRASRRGRVRGAATRFLLRRVRELAGYRETPKFYAVLLISRARALLLRAGGELAATGRVDRPADLFFLTLPEARAAVAGTDQRELVRRRRTEYERERRRRHVPRVLLSDGTEPRAEPAGTSGGLAGTPASAGTVSGVARVVRSPDGARLEPGQILVAPSTDPGWTPLFLTAGGLVMEMGGMMSHGAVVAREYGIPAVVGVDGATDRIASGSRITVDGSAGVVTLDVPLAAPD
ncbi:MAG TPA: PEP-utilizing enzyme, partial [Candidatus Limnocylindria bacterium]